MKIFSEKEKQKNEYLGIVIGYQYPCKYFPWD